MAARFEIYKSTSKTGGYRWRLRASNGEVVASGQGYKTKAACKKGMEAVRRAAGKAEVQEV